MYFESPSLRTKRITYTNLPTKVSFSVERACAPGAMKLQLFQCHGKLDLGEGPQSPQEMMGKLRKREGHYTSTTGSHSGDPRFANESVPMFYSHPRSPAVGHWDEDTGRVKEGPRGRKTGTQGDRVAQGEEDTGLLSSCAAPPEPRVSDLVNGVMEGSCTLTYSVSFHSGLVNSFQSTLMIATLT